MNDINLQPDLFRWLRNQKRMQRPLELIPSAFISVFDEMISSFGRTGWWSFPGSYDDFRKDLLVRLDTDRRLRRSNKSIPNFVLETAQIMRDCPHQNELRVHYLGPMVDLFGSLGHPNLFWIWEDGVTSVVSSTEEFEAAFGFKIQVTIPLEPPFPG